MNKYTEATLLISGLFGFLCFASGANWKWALGLSIALAAVGRIIILVDKP